MLFGYIFDVSNFCEVWLIIRTFFVKLERLLYQLLKPFGLLVFRLDDDNRPLALDVPHINPFRVIRTMFMIRYSLQ